MRMRTPKVNFPASAQDTPTLYIQYVNFATTNENGLRKKKKKTLIK